MKFLSTLSFLFIAAVALAQGKFSGGNNAGYALTSQNNVTLSPASPPAATPNHAYSVGINTTSPQITLDIQKDSQLPETQAQGVSFPNFKTSEREKFTNIKAGTLIYNTDLDCIEMYSSTNGWNCL